MLKPLKVIGVDQITTKDIWLAVITLVLFNCATNSVFELWKLSPSFSLKANPDTANILLYSTPIVLFIIWILVLWLINRMKNPLLIENKKDKVVMPHKGLVLALSKPAQAPEEICSLINATPEEHVNDLYEIIGIGQAFKALCHHKKLLNNVWLVRTKTSDPYDVCIKTFLKKFNRKCKVHMKDDNMILTENNDDEVIEQTKSILTKIYAKEHLASLGLKSSDVIVDITGGTKPITIGLTFGALSSSIDIQYVEQKNKRIISLSITPEIILDKVGEYHLEKYTEYLKMKQSGCNV